MSPGREHVGWPRTLWRNLYWWREDRRVRARYAGVKQIVYFGGHGIGDELLLSAPLHELRRRGGGPLGTMTSRPEFFRNSPDVDHVLPMEFRDVEFLRRQGVAVHHAGYIHQRLPPDIDVPPERPLLAEMCARCGVTGEVDLRPWLWLTDAERAPFAGYAGAIVVQSSRQGASLDLGNKEWLMDRFQQVAETLGRRHRLVQIGQPGDPLLHGAEDLRGKTNLRESAALLAQSAAFLGLVGFAMHLARAVDCPAVIIYGGRERPDQSGYICNENIYSAVPCAPCWRWNSCDYERRCMTAIHAPEVIAAVDRLLARPRGVLAVQRVIVS